jgi:hypothetical protein
MSDLDSFLIPQDAFKILFELKKIPVSLLPDIELPLSNQATFDMVCSKVRGSGLSSVGFDKGYIFNKVYSMLVDLDKKEDEYVDIAQTALNEIITKKFHHYSRKRKNIYEVEPYEYYISQHEPTINSLPTKIWNRFGGKSFTISAILPVGKHDIKRNYFITSRDIDPLIESPVIESMIDISWEMNTERINLMKIAEALPTLFSISPEKTHLLSHRQLLIQHEDRSFYLVYSKGFDLLLNFDTEVKCRI